MTRSHANLDMEACACNTNIARSSRGWRQENSRRLPVYNWSTKKRRKRRRRSKKKKNKRKNKKEEEKQKVKEEREEEGGGGEEEEERRRRRRRRQGPIPDIVLRYLDAHQGMLVGPNLHTHIDTQRFLNIDVPINY
jgi:hypothetical protein